MKQQKRKQVNKDSKNDQTIAVLEDKVALLESQIKEKSQHELTYVENFNQ